ncbi:ubiquitin-conjugating enzyme/RWD-like protein [Gongronella butleri]|nr:ubiquitin-conjugating enzyme/RWD-like protein [Gongronella butleri]
MPPAYNLKNSAVKRILQEAKELANERSTQYTAHPLEDNIFEWHFTVTGPRDTDFDGGIYHGRILLPAEYPFKPPHLIFLTPNGRFQLNTKICLSITDHHPEFWQPAWGIRTVLLAVQGFFPTPGAGALGSLDCSREERAIWAKKSKSWRCNVCDLTNAQMLPKDLGVAASAEAPASKAEDAVDLSMFSFAAAPSPASSSTEQAFSSTAQKSSSSAATPAIVAPPPTSVPAAALSPRPARAEAAAQPSSNSFSSASNTNGVRSRQQQPQHAQQPARRTDTQQQLQQEASSTLWIDASIGLLITVLLYLIVHRFGGANG